MTAIPTPHSGKVGFRAAWDMPAKRWWGEHEDLEFCRLCGRAGRLRMERHHIDYENDRVEVVCHRCHMRIHAGLLRPDLKPLVSRRDYIALRKKRRAEAREALRASKRAAAAEEERLLRIAFQVAENDRKLREGVFTCSCGFAGPTRYRTTCKACRRPLPGFVIERNARLALIAMYQVRGMREA